MEPWEIEARECIRDLVARYNANGDSGRIGPMMELFAEDAVMTVAPEQSYQGREAIRGFFGGVARGTQEDRPRQGSARFIRHFTATHQIDVESETEARGRCYFLVLTDRGLDHWGRYLDEYRKLEGRWLFWRRTCRTDARVEGGWSTARSPGTDRPDGS